VHCTCVRVFSISALSHEDTFNDIKRHKEIFIIPPTYIYSADIIIPLLKTMYYYIALLGLIIGISSGSKNDLELPSNQEVAVS